jgi:hypothetical protein
MRKALALSFVVLAVLVLGCTEEQIIGPPEELSPPLGLVTVTGHEEVILYWWCSNYEDNLSGYIIYSKEGATADQDPQETIPTGFEVVGRDTVGAPSAGQRSVYIEGLQNGVTYSFLVVAAMEDWGTISHTSNIVEDTPREETATEITIYAYQSDPTQSGFELSDFTVVSCVGLDANYDTPTGTGDIMCERFDILAGTRAWIDGINGGAIQDLGYMSDWNEADIAPALGYASTGHSLEAIATHVYAIKTGDNHFAKIQITGMDGLNYSWIRFKAAYQPDPNNREYR